MHRKSVFRSRRAWITIAGLLLISAVLTIFFADSLRITLTPPSKRLLAEGRRFTESGRLPEAVLSYRQAVEANPNDPEALLALAEAYQAQGRTRMAERYRARWVSLTGVHVTSAPSQSDEALSLAWMIPISETPPTGVFASERAIVVAFESGEVAAVTREGVLQWHAQLPASATSAPAADTQAAWVGAQDGALYALGLSDGAVLWRFQTSAPVYAQPVRSRDLVYCASSDGTLYALEKSSGEAVWRFQTSGAILAAPAWDGNRLFIGSTDGKIYALDAGSGAPLWQDGISTSGPVESQPTALDGRVLVGSGDGRIYSLAQDSGGQYWRAPTGDAVYAAPLAADGLVYVASSANALHAFDWLSGERLWKTDFGSALRAAPLKIGKTLYVTAEADSAIHLLDAATGVERAVLDTDDWIAGMTREVDNLLIVAGKDGALLAYHLPDMP